MRFPRKIPPKSGVNRRFQRLYHLGMGQNSQQMDVRTERRSSRRSVRAQLAGVGNAIAVARKPAIACMNQPVEPWQTEYSIERPSPPDAPCDIEIDVSAEN